MATAAAPESDGWREFNHDTRLVLHTLRAHVQRAAGLAHTDAQRQALQGVQQCSDSLLALLDAFAARRQLPDAATAPASADFGDSLFASAAPAAQTLVLPPLPADELKQFEQMMLAGLLLDIEQWASGLAQRHPEWATLADALGFYAYSADLRSLQTVLERWLAASR